MCERLHRPAAAPPPSPDFARSQQAAPSQTKTAVAVAAAYYLLFKLSSYLSARYAPRVYNEALANAGERADWDSRLPSTVHALAVSALILLSALRGDFSASSVSDDDGGVSPLPPPALRATRLSRVAVGASLGYFAADALMLCCYPSIAGPEIAAHHAAALASLAAALQVDRGHLYVLVTLLMEVRAFFLWCGRCFVFGALNTHSAHDPTCYAPPQKKTQ